MQFSGLGQSRGSTGRSLHGPVRGAGAPSVGAANLVGEKRAFLQWLSELEAPPNQAIDVEAILQHGMGPREAFSVSWSLGGCPHEKTPGRGERDREFYQRW